MDLPNRTCRPSVRLRLPNPPVVAVVCDYLGRSGALKTLSLLRLSCVSKEFFTGLERSVWKPLYLATAHGSDGSDISLGVAETKSASFRSKYLRRQSKESFNRRNRTMSEGAQYITGTGSATENSIIMEIFVIGESSQLLADLICTKSEKTKDSIKRDTALYLADNTVVKCTIWAFKDIVPDSENDSGAVPGACVADAIVLTYQPTVMGSWTRMNQNLQVVQNQQAGSMDEVPIFLVALDSANDDADSPISRKISTQTTVSDRQDSANDSSADALDQLASGGAAQGVYDPDVLKSLRKVMKRTRLEYRLLKQALQVKLGRALDAGDKDLLSHIIVIRVTLSRAADDKLSYLAQRNELERQFGRSLFDFEKEEVTDFVVSSTGATGAVTRPNHGDYALVADAAFFAKQHALHFIEVARPLSMSSASRGNGLQEPASAQPEAEKFRSIQSQANRVIFVVAATVVAAMRKQHTAASPGGAGAGDGLPHSDDERVSIRSAHSSSWSSSHEADEDFDFEDFDWVNKSSVGVSGSPDSGEDESAAPAQTPPRDYVLCPMGHRLKRHLTHDNLWACSYCRQRLEVNTVMFGCRTCNFDLCIICNIRFTCHLKKMRAKKIEEDEKAAAAAAAAAAGGGGGGGESAAAAGGEGGGAGESSSSSSAAAATGSATASAASSKQLQAHRLHAFESKDVTCSVCTVM